METEMSVFVSRFPKQDDWIEFGHGMARMLVWRSLLQDKKLRNGWGGPKYDLRQGKESWIDHAMQKSLGRDEQSTETREGAQKRYDILKLMLEVEKDDIIIIPNVSATEPYDSNSFTVVTAKRRYDFESLSLDSLGEYDFGHFITVRNIQSFIQHDFQINFGAWQKAFNRVNDQRIYDFLARHYRSI